MRTHQYICKRGLFYRERDRRTTEYINGQTGDTHYIRIGVGNDAATSSAGQFLILSLANLLARVHREIIFIVEQPATELTASVPFARPSLGDTLIKTCKEIDPWGSFTIRTQRPQAPGISIGIGEDPGLGFDWYLGADRALAYLQKEPCPLATSIRGTLRGCALAACLGAAAVFRETLGMTVVPRVLSAWNLREGSKATPGPDDLELLDMGSVLLVGAGAVGSALAYWLYSMGVGGRWTTLDKDHIELHNTNRCMLFTARDAGWPEGIRSGQGKQKIDVVAEYLPGCSYPEWYHEARITRNEFDLILVLANDHDVRTRVAQRLAPVVLHATTGTAWLSQLHRHIAGRDDCIRCRTHDIRPGTFACSTGPAPISAVKASEDRALPFLSAASGLMLATALQRHQVSELQEDPWNDWRWDFASAYKMSSGGQRQCTDSCPIVGSIPAFQ